MDDPNHSYYEGHELQTSTFPIRVLSLLGIKMCIGKSRATIVVDLTTKSIVTNAAGGLNPSYKIGDVVVIHDVIPPEDYHGRPILTMEAHQLSRSSRDKSTTWAQHQ